jgi:hypothetical protein
MERVSMNTSITFWVFSPILVLVHAINFYRSTHFYCRDGFILVLICMVCLGIVVLFRAWIIPGVPADGPQCQDAVGYCSTISCMSGNFLAQGAVHHSQSLKHHFDTKHCHRRGQIPLNS